MVPKSELLGTELGLCPDPGAGIQAALFPLGELGL